LTFGEFVKGKRIKLSLSFARILRAEWLRSRQSVKLERGHSQSPDDETFMGKLAAALHDEEGFSDWFDFHNYASVAESRFPKTCLTMPKSLISASAFRTLQANRWAAEKMG